VAAPVHGYSLAFIQSMLTERAGRVAGWFRDLELRSVLQPAYSLQHKRAIGYEASTRGMDPEGRPVATDTLFGPVENYSETALLDYLCTAMHVHNFMHDRPQGLLFLNLHQEIFLDFLQAGEFLAELFGHYRVEKDRVVIDVPASILSERAIEGALAHYRKLGCLIAIDDFGAGNSDLDSLQYALPTVVKLNRSVIAAAMRDARDRQMLPRAVSMLHGLGALVMMEGIETRDEALAAIDADADLAGGFYFGAPQENLSGFIAPDAVFDELWSAYREQRSGEKTGEPAARTSLQEEKLHSAVSSRALGSASPAEIGRYREERRPFIAELQRAASLVKGGAELEAASTQFLQLPGAIRCFMLDHNGKQIGMEAHARSAPTKQGVDFSLPEDRLQSDWSRRDFFRRAVNEPEVVQITRPYPSFSGYSHCVTFSVAVKALNKLSVICGDVDWSAHVRVGR
jgi:EAL domain-containing protein (putative c-di-GMP-specific phosphodiesterase class I)